MIDRQIALCRNGRGQFLKDDRKDMFYMIKRKLLIILLCLSMLVCGSGFVYGMTTTSVINEFETGIVDIE